MSTLTTRICGYKVVVERATVEQIQSHADTCNAQGWAQPDYSRAVTARFVNDDDILNELPYELRSTIMTVNPEVVLDVMAQHVDELNNRVTYAAEYHVWDCDCDNCYVSLAMLDRQYGILRGNNN